MKKQVNKQRGHIVQNEIYKIEKYKRIYVHVLVRLFAKVGK